MGLPVGDAGGSLTVDNGGTFATQVTGDALTALQLLDDIVRAEDDASADTHKGAVILVKRADTPGATSGTDGDYEPLQVAGGRLWVDASGKTLTVASHAVTNAGTFATQVDGDALTALQLIDNIVRNEDDASASGHGGAVMLARRTDSPANQSGTDGDYEFLQVAAGRLWASSVVETRTSGGATPYNNTDVQEVKVEIKDTGGTIYALYVWNLTAAPLWLKFYDLDADDVTPGTTAPTVDLMVPGNGDSDGAGFTVPIPPQGWNFTTAITISGSTTRGTTAVDVGTAGNLGMFALYA